MPDRVVDPNNDLPTNWTHAGRLLRSVTHDVNNQLGTMLAYAELIALAPERHDDTIRMARDIAAAVRDSTALLDTLTGIVAYDLVTIETINLPVIISRVADLFRFELERGGAGLEVTLPREVCVFPGVRTRILRALVHGIRYAAGQSFAAQPKKKVHIRLTHTATAFRVTIEMNGGASLPQEEAFPADLAEAREHLRYHQGDLVYMPEGQAVFDIPRETRLIKPGA